MAIPDGPSRTSLSSALEILRLEQKLWVRLAATRKQSNDGEGPWQEMMLDIVSGEAPPGWKELCWRYSSVLFIAIEQTGEAVAQWLEYGQVRLNGEDIELPVIHGEVEWQLHDSKSSWSSYAPLPWPTRTVSFGSQAAGSESGVGMLLDDVAPPFASYYFGAAFVFGIAQPIGGRATAAPMWRDQRKFGRIKHVRLVPHEGVVVVDVEGEDIDGATVDLTGSKPGSSVSLKSNGPQTVELEMYEELTQGSLVILRKGQRSLDRRSVTRQYGRGDEPDVELVEEEGNRLQGPTHSVGQFVGGANSSCDLRRVRDRGPS